MKTQYVRQIAAPVTRTVANTATAGSGRVISYVLSTSGVARDGATIAQDGWKLDAYRANPVVLWAHDSGAPPIGRMLNIGVIDGQLRGDVEYVGPEVYPFGDTIYRLVKAGYLSAVSVSWQPIQMRISNDPKRLGAIDFIAQELLEVSQVPVPSDVGALATARANGIDTSSLRDWAERKLNARGIVPARQAELQALSKAAAPPLIVAGGAYSEAERRARARADLRRATYETCRDHGGKIPAWAWPPADAFEFECTRRCAERQAAALAPLR
jgi:phage head maturation protease